MKKDFQIVSEHPTPEELLTTLVGFAPGFADVWKESYFRDKNGSFTVHGVFAEFSSYFRRHFEEMEGGTRRALFTFVEHCVTTNPSSENGISNAACTCFLENIAGEGDRSRLALDYLGPESKKYFDQWN